MKLLICQSCGVVIRSRGKHCTGCGIQLALNSPTQMPSFSQIQMRPPLAVSVKQDHLLLERVVTERQLNVLTLRPRATESPFLDDDGTDNYLTHSDPGVFAYDGHGGNGGNGGNGSNGGNGNGGNGHGGNGGGYGSEPSSPYARLGDEDQSSNNTPVNTPWNTGAVPADPQAGLSASDFGWNSGGMQSAPQTQSQPEPVSNGGFFAPSPNNNIYLKSTVDSVAEVNETPELVEVQDSTSQHLGNLSLEDSSAHLPVQSEPFESASAPEPFETPPVKMQEPEPPVQRVAPTVAGLSSQPGAAISIAIGGGVAGMVAGQMLSRMSPKEEPKVEPKEEPTGSTAGSAVEAPVANAEAPVDSAPLADSSDVDDFFAATPSSSIVENEPVRTAEPVAQEEPAAPIGTQSSTNNSVVSDSVQAEASNSSSMTQDEEPKGNPIGDPAPSAETDAFFEAKAKSDVDDFFGTARSTEPRKDSNSFFEEDEGGGFDFFSSPADAASRRPASSLEEEIAEKPKPEKKAEAPSKTEMTAPPVSKGSELAPEPEVQERPKVAMPKSITQSRTKLKLTEDEEEKAKKVSLDEADEEEDADESDAKSKVKPPKRRNFSGGGSDEAPSKSSKKKPPAKSSKDADEDDDDDDDSSPGGALTWLEEEVSLGGMSVSRKTAGVLVAVGLFIAIQIPGWLMTFGKAVTGSAGQQQQQQQIASGAGGMQGMPGQGMPGQGMPGQGMPGQGMPAQGGFPVGLGAQTHQGGFPGGAGTGLSPGAPGGTPPGMQAAPGTVPGAQQQPGWIGPIPVVAGQWNIQVRGGGTIFAGQMVLRQNGPNIGGAGSDQAGRYEIAGRLLPPDQLQFNKKYDPESRKNGAHKFDILFQGKLLPQKNGSVATVGRYKTQKQQGSSFGYLNKLRYIPIEDDFTAQQMQIGVNEGASTAVASAPGTATVSAPPGENPLLSWLKPPKDDIHSNNTNEAPYQKAQKFFLTVAGGFVAVGVLIFLFFLRLFGPAGQMNVWEKEKYIPSQFRPEHMKMVREMGKPLKPGGTPFGKREEWRFWTFWTPKFLSLTAEQRKQNPHMLLIGGGDKGKTRLMASMVTHDIKSDDRAIVVIDSDGQLSDLIIEWIASQADGAKYAKRVVLVDPTYKAGSLAYNPLEMPEDGDLQAASSAIVHGFKAIYTEPPGAQSQWNAQTANILRNAALLLIANGRTLTDLPNLLQDNDFRDIMLEAVERKKDHKTEYITILETWNQYKKLARTDQWITWVEPILNRVGPMLSDGRIRPILTKPVSDLKLKEIIKKKKILIVKVPQGELDQNANLLGSLIVTGLQQAAMSLCREEGVNIKDRPVALYLDEMDSFVEKESIENITSETKRYQLGFVATIKTLQHLPEDYRNQLIINMGTMAVFAISKKDGDMLGPQMFRVDGRKIKHQTIQNFFNKVNTTPQFELIMDEEKLNIDRIVGQNEQTFFCYRVGTVAGVFRLKAFDFKDVPEKKINRKLIEKMHAITDSFGSDKKKSKAEKEDKASD